MTLKSINSPRSHGDCRLDLLGLPIRPASLRALGLLSLLIFSCKLTAGDASAKVPLAQYVILISVDGLGSAYIKPLLQSGLTNELTTFKRLQSEGVGTLNARDDANYAITLPNHTSMVTGRGVVGPAGHNLSLIHI